MLKGEFGALFKSLHSARPATPFYYS